MDLVNITTIINHYDSEEDANRKDKKKDGSPEEDELCNSGKCAGGVVVPRYVRTRRHHIYRLKKEPALKTHWVKRDLRMYILFTQPEVNGSLLMNAIATSLDHDRAVLLEVEIHHLPSCGETGPAKPHR